MISDFINYLIKLLIKGILHIFWVFPIERKKITLLNELSYTYGDSLKYIDQYIHRKKKKYKIVFPIKNGAVSSEYDDDIIVSPKTWDYFRQVLTSEVIITNAGGVSYLPKRKKQRIISTWHGGGPYKKTSTDVYNNYWYKKQSDMNSDNTDYILSSCKYFSDYEARSMGFTDEKIVPAGLPRNDILFQDHSDVKEKVRKYFLIPDDTKVVLFAPTFRSKYNDFSEMDVEENYIEIDINRVLATFEEKYKCKWICGVRFHPKLKDVKVINENAFNCSTYPDMQELLCCADAVISDYSSLIWDYSFTVQPLFLYAPDIDRYEKERGFYMPSSEWPYPIAHNNDELVEVIRRFDKDEYEKNVRKHHELSGSYETGKSCSIVVSLMEKMDMSRV